jgi:hypothetical protein
VTHSVEHVFGIFPVDFFTISYTHAHHHHPPGPYTSLEDPLSSGLQKFRAAITIKMVCQVVAYQDATLEKTFWQRRRNDTLKIYAFKRKKKETSNCRKIKNTQLCSALDFLSESMVEKLLDFM